MNELISVIVPVKNGEKYLKEAIEGIQKQKMNVEIIVINDGSTDQTEKIAREMGCIVVNHEQSFGQVAAKNTGLKILPSDIFLILPLQEHLCNSLSNIGSKHSSHQ